MQASTLLMQDVPSVLAQTKMGVFKDNKLCMNCLGEDISSRSGHLAKDAGSVTSHTVCGCTSMPRASIVRHPRWARTLGNRWTMELITNVSLTMQHKQVLLTTCNIQILRPDEFTTQFRASLDSASSTLLIIKCLVQRLGLKRKRLNASISGTVEN